MIDHFVVLTPLLLLPIVLLFAFVGCAFQTHGLDLEPRSSSIRMCLARD